MELVAGRYQVVRELGRGGMGVVHLARDLELDRPVAIKVLLSELSDEDSLQRFQIEAEAVARLQHPGVVAIHEVGSHNGNPFLVMDYVAGSSLEGLLRDDGPLDQHRAAALIAEMADALEHAHQRGILHRDLKPANVLIDEAGRPRITDFGLARDMTREQRERLTQTGMTLGTPSYMPPEQAAGEPERFGPHSDVYSLGATLYVLLSGAPPFVGPHYLNVLAAVLSNPPVPPSSLRPDLDRDLEAICLRCLEKEPRRRYPSAADLAADLRRYLSGEPVTATPSTAARRLRRWLRRHRATISLVGLGVALVAGATLLALAATGVRPTPTRTAKPATPLPSNPAPVETSTRKTGTVAPERASEPGPAPGFVGPPNRLLTPGQRRGVVLARGRRVLTLFDQARTHSARCQLWDSLERTMLGAWMSRASIRAAAGHPDGQSVVFIGDSAELVRVDAETGRVQGRWRCPSKATVIALGPQQRWVAVGGRITGGRVRVHDLRDDEHYGLPGHAGRVTALAFAQGGKTLLVANYVRRGQTAVSLWDLTTRSRRGRLEFMAQTNVIAVHGDRAVTGTGRGFLHAIDLKQGRRTKTWRAHDRMVTDATFSPEGRRLYTISRESRELTSWNGHTLREISRSRLKEEPRGLALADRGRLLFLMYSNACELWRREEPR